MVQSEGVAWVAMVEFKEVLQGFGRSVVCEILNDVIRRKTVVLTS